MPRKKKTIKDFVVTYDHTTPIHTTHRSTIKKPSYTIIIDFTDQKIKYYRYLNIHTTDDQEMMQFLERLNNILLKLNHCVIDFDYVKIKKKNIKIEYDCDWREMPAFHCNPLMNNYGSVVLSIEVTDDPKYLQFIQSYHQEFDCILWSQISTMWYPQRSKLLSLRENKMYLTTFNYQPRYPIYIVSKGRYEKRYTSKYLEWINVNYKIVVEPDEYQFYLEHIDKEKILILPKPYLNLNQGSIPARNYVWWHAKQSGAARHWILDDNIASYKRFLEGQKSYVKSGVVFTMIEDYVDRYTNVKMAGHNYTMFGVSLNTKMQPITPNTRIYSSILLSNDIFPDFTWRGKYNEDTDLSLRILKMGYPTLLFNCVLADKLRTMTQKGGNTDSIYTEKDALLKKAKSLQKQHPDVTKIVHKFGRVHHHVDYNQFKDNQLDIKDLTIGEDSNEYGMYLIDKDVTSLYK